MNTETVKAIIHLSPIVVSVVVVVFFMTKKQPWQVLFLAAFLIIGFLGEYCKAYIYGPRFLRFYVADFSTVPAFTTFYIFMRIVVIGYFEKSDFLKKHIFVYALFSLFIWTTLELISVDTDLYDILMYCCGTILTYCIVATFPKDLNFILKG